MVICPACEHGIIYKAQLKKKNIEIFICDECDTVWENKNRISNKGEFFELYMQRFNLPGLWDELCNIEKL